MSRVNKVVLSDSGQVFKNKAKNLSKRKDKHDFKKSEQPVSRSQDWQDEGIYKTARVMKAGNGNKFHSFSSCAYKHTDESPNPKYDGRCHPFWRKVI